MIARLITRTKTIKRQSKQFVRTSTLKCEQTIDRYQLIKKFFIVGTVANLYFCYIAFAKYSIYGEISHNINDKFEQFNKNQSKQKQMVLQLMRQMDTIKAERQNMINNNDKDRMKEISQISSNEYLKKLQQKKKQREGQKQKQKKQSSSSFLQMLGFSSNKNKKDEYI